MSNLLSKPVPMLVVLMSFVLTGCVTTTASKGPTNSTASFCKVAEPIYWSGKDSDKTIAQVREHNAVGKKLCKWGS